MTVHYVPRIFGGTIILSGVAPPPPIIAKKLFLVLTGGNYLLGSMPLMSTVNPYSTVQYTLTVTNITGASETQCGPVNVVVTFPDGTTTTYGLGTGVTNLGAGAYKLIYTSKSPGINREVWSVTSGDGVSIGSFANDTPVTY